MSKQNNCYTTQCRCHGGLLCNHAVLPDQTETCLNVSTL